MPSTTEPKVPAAFQPRPEDYRYDLDRALMSVVGLHSIIPPDAFSAETLGTERTGHLVLDLAGRYAGALHRFRHHMAGQGRAVGVVERAPIGLADAGTRGGNDDCIL